MRIARLSTGLILALVGVYLQAQPPEQTITVTGKLVRAMAIGGESTGWALELESATLSTGSRRLRFKLVIARQENLKNWKTST